MEGTNPEPVEPAGYEFAPTEERVIWRTARQAGVWGGISLLGGILGGVALVPLVLARPATGVLLLIAPGLYLFIGSRFLRARKELRDVVASRGRDIDHLLTALEKLGDALFVLNALTIAAILLGVAGAFVLGAFGLGM